MCNDANVKCHCYGDICLVNGDCFQGNVYVSGVPVCHSGEQGWGLQGGRVTCKALGFYDQERTSRSTIR